MERTASSSAITDSLAKRAIWLQRYWSSSASKKAFWHDAGVKAQAIAYGTSRMRSNSGSQVTQPPSR